MPAAAAPCAAVCARGVPLQPPCSSSRPESSFSLRNVPARGIQAIDPGATVSLQFVRARSNAHRSASPLRTPYLYWQASRPILAGLGTPISPPHTHTPAGEADGITEIGGRMLPTFLVHPATDRRRHAGRDVDMQAERTQGLGCFSACVSTSALAGCTRNVGRRRHACSEAQVDPRTDRGTGGLGQ